MYVASTRLYNFKLYVVICLKVVATCLPLTLIDINRSVVFLGLIGDVYYQSKQYRIENPSLNFISTLRFHSDCQNRLWQIGPKVAKLWKHSENLGISIPRVIRDEQNMWSLVSHSYIDTLYSSKCGSMSCLTVFPSYCENARPTIALSSHPGADPRPRRSFRRHCQEGESVQFEGPPCSVPAECQHYSGRDSQRAYDFYRAFVVDGDPRKMFSLIDSTYKVSYPYASQVSLHNSTRE